MSRRRKKKEAKKRIARFYRILYKRNMKEDSYLPFEMSRMKLFSKTKKFKVIKGTLVVKTPFRFEEEGLYEVETGVAVKQNQKKS